MKFRDFANFTVKNSVALLYEDSYGAGIILKELMKTLRDRKIYYVVFTDMNDRRTKKYFESLAKIDSEFGEVLKEVRAVKVGRIKEVFNDNLHAYVEMVGDVEGIFHDLALIVKKFEEDSLVIYDGMFLFHKMCGEKRFFESLDRFVSTIPNFRGVALVPMLTDNVDNTISYIFDLVLKVRRSEKFYYVGRREYEVEILYSIFPELSPVLAFKIIQDEIVEM